jgi:cytidylate kinase
MIDIPVIAPDGIAVIAIDGTAASGKGTLARRLAAHLGYAYLDTGLLYRAVAWTLIAQGIPTEDAAAAIKAAQTLDPALLDNPDLRSGAAGRGASVVGAVPDVQRRECHVRFRLG